MAQEPKSKLKKMRMPDNRSDMVGHMDTSRDSEPEADSVPSDGSDSYENQDRFDWSKQRPEGTSDEGNPDEQSGDSSEEEQSEGEYKDHARKERYDGNDQSLANCSDEDLHAEMARRLKKKPQ